MSHRSASDDLTQRVVETYSRIDDLRLREIVVGLIRHLHTYVKEVRLKREEWETAWSLMARMAESTGPKRNEFLLLGDLIGVSQLVETFGHERPGWAVGYALAGPFFRANAPLRQRGESIASIDTAGERVRISGRVYDLTDRAPVAGAMLDVWQAATNGLYENQDDAQPDYNLRGRFRTDESGTFEIVALKPTSYAFPVEGPVGELLKVAKQRPYRPAHIHFIVSAPGYETLITQVFVEGDETLRDDPVFTASENMVGKFRRENGECRLHYDFQLEPGVSTMPKSPLP
jgi:catechol 1,2-dioxygenase